MKPRLPSAPHTEEDYHIWLVRRFRLPFQVLRLYSFSLESDRHDAWLMLQFEKCRRADLPAATRHTLLGTIGVPYSEIEAMFS